MSQDKSLSEEELTRRARASLESYEVSDDVRRKLRRARANAVEQIAQSEDRSGYAGGRGRWLIPAGLLGAVGALGTVWIMSQQVTPTMPMLEEQELAALTDMELLEEIEFYAWMMEQTDGAVPDEG